jgi:hypothetical protein
MAASSDVLDGDHLAWDHHSLFYTGPEESDDCMKLRKAVQNEITRQNLTVQFRADLK